jgi:hypothetical protein
MPSTIKCGTAARGDRLSGSVVAVPKFVAGRSLRSPGGLDYRAASQTVSIRPALLKRQTATFAQRLVCPG